MKRDMICPTCGEFGFAIRDVAVSVNGKLKCYHCGEWSLSPEWKTVGQLRRSLSAAEKERDELLKEAEATLKFFAEKGRVVVARDGNAVQRMGASAEIAILKAEAERLKSSLAYAVMRDQEGEITRLIAERDTALRERDEARRAGRMEALNAVFQINGPSRAITRLKEEYNAEREGNNGKV